MAKDTPGPQEYFDSAMILVGQGRINEAGAYFEKALLLKPDYHEAWGNRANVLHHVGNHFDAILNYNQAIQIAPKRPEYWNNRGATWLDMRCLDKAGEDYRKAIELAPDMAEAHSNLGNLCKLRGKIPEAKQHYKDAIKANPSYIDAKLNKSIMDLESGDLIEGFTDYEVRWKSGQLPPRGFPYPSWEGEDLNGKRLILYSEQGLGDAVQFVRYATEIKRLYPNATVAVEVRQTLVKLCQTVPGVDEVITYGEDPKKADYVCAMLSAPRVLKTTMETIPAPYSYMTPSPYRVEVWKHRIKEDLGKFGGVKLVGICWSGQSRPMQPVANSVDQRRSTNLAQWAPLAIPGVLFVNLQMGAGAAQIKSPPVGMTIADYSEQFDDFADTAALIQNLDLVISVDTSVVHVAAAIGKPVWMLSRFDGCWRWHGDRSDSPWYPTLRQFRQPAYGDWDALFKQVAEELKQWAVDQPLHIAAE